jgi:hypothetical protein
VDVEISRRNGKQVGDPMPVLSMPRHHLPHLVRPQAHRSIRLVSHFISSRMIGL